MVANVEKSIAAVICAAVAMTASAATAQDSGPYVALHVGGTAPTKLKFDVGATAATADGVVAENSTGYALDLSLGYQIDRLRIGVEVARRQSWLQSMTTTVTVPISNDETPKTAKGNFPGASGSLGVQSAMLSTEYEFKRRDDVAFFLGAGVGIASLDLQDFEAVEGVALLDGANRTFAQQVSGGARYRLDDRLAVELRYTYLRTNAISTADSQGRAYYGKYATHSGMAGFSYRF